MNIEETLEIDYSKITPIDVSETMILSQELLDKYAIDTAIQHPLFETHEVYFDGKSDYPEAHTITMEEKLQYIKKILDYDVTEPIKNLFDDVLSFVSKL